MTLMTKCFTQAHQSKMASIAFSSIGTGTLKFPCDVVAKVYFDVAISFSKKHPNTTLKDIRFVPFDQDIPTVKAFKDELSKRTSNATTTARPAFRQQSSVPSATVFSAVTERSSDHLQLDVDGLCFQVQTGDITKETTDAIVVVTNPELDLAQGDGVGAAILDSGGASIQNECSMHAKQGPGSVVVTKAGSLPTKHILHIVPPDSLTPNTLEAVVVKCLQVAEGKRITSISFPAIGTGNLGMDVKDCAKFLLASVEKFTQQLPTSLQLIRITIFQTQMINEFRSVMKEKSGEKESSQPGVLSRVTTGVTKRVRRVANFVFGRTTEVLPSTSATSVPRLSLEVFAGNKDHLGNAIKAVNAMMDDHCKQHVINHEAIEMLSKDQESRIHTAQLRFDTEVQIEKKVGRIELLGNSEDILEVSVQIHEILDELKEDEHKRDRAEMLAKHAEWEYSNGGKFEKYPTEINAEIESAYLAKKREVKFSMAEGSELHTYTIDFKANKETDHENGFVTDVRRRDHRKGKIISRKSTFRSYTGT